jgi:HSP20 family protein
MTMLTVRPEGRRFARPGFSHLFENIFESELPTYFQNEWSKLATPSVNIKETKDAYQLHVSAPGFSKEGFSIKVEDSLLTISAEAKEEKLEEGEKLTRREFTHQSFKRSFTLPKTVVADKIAAAYENGILNVTLPKMEEAKQKGAIEVKIS